MSTYFSVFTKKKEEELGTKNCFELLYLTTTPARELDEDMHFVYSKRTEINAAFINEIVAALQLKIDYYNAAILESEKEKQTLLSIKTESKEVYQSIREDLSCIKEQVDDYEEELEFYRYLISVFKNIVIQIDINNDDYDFFYFYG